MAKRGPKGPSTSVNWVDFEKLCALHCTEIEIAEFFDIKDVKTLNSHVKRKYGQNFSQVIKRKSAKGKISLRRKMYELAQGGNVTMCIWLSKQHLGMTDKVEEKSIVQTEQVVELQWADENYDSKTKAPDAPPKKD